MRLRVPAALAADVLAIVAFVSIGRRNHDEAVDASGVVGTAAPFLLALGLGWLVLRLWQRPTSTEWALGLWAITLTLGMVLRKVVWDDGTATAFVIVASVVLFVLFVGWRSAFTWWQGRRTND